MHGAGSDAPWRNARHVEPPKLVHLTARRSRLDRDEVPGERPRAPLRDGQRPGDGHSAPLEQRTGRGLARRAIFTGSKNWFAGTNWPSPPRVRSLPRWSLGLGVSTWMFFKEKQARQRAVAAEQEQARLRQQAEAEAAESRRIATFIGDLSQSLHSEGNAAKSNPLIAYRWRCG